MPTNQHSQPNRFTGGGGQPTNAEQNYTALYYGNDHGSISFGHIHETANVTSSVLLQAHDGRHSITLDRSGNRKGWTQMTATGNISLSCGYDNKEAQDSLAIHAENGNILITATNGKIRMQGTDIELVAVGEGTGKGNIRLNASQNIVCEAQDFLVKANSTYRLMTSGSAEVIASGVLTIYGGMCKGVTDACAVKDTWNSLQRTQKKYNNT